MCSTQDKGGRPDLLLNMVIAKQEGRPRAPPVALATGGLPALPRACCVMASCVVIPTAIIVIKFSYLLMNSTALNPLKNQTEKPVSYLALPAGDVHTSQSMRQACLHPRG